MPAPTDQLLLWEIVLPAEFPLIVHQAWDAQIRAISGGLTILHKAKGQWVDDHGEITNEPVILVRIACTRQQMEQIVTFTADWYSQSAVMYYVISNEVYIRHFLSNEEPDKDRPSSAINKNIR